MSAGVLETISYVAFACSFLFILLSVVLFVKLNIKSIIDDLSGKRAERQIQAFREQNASRQKDINIMLGRSGNANLDAVDTNEVTVRLNIDNTQEELEQTELLYNETVLLTESDKVAVGQGDSDWKLIFNEIVVHTEERI